MGIVGKMEEEVSLRAGAVRRLRSTHRRHDDTQRGSEERDGCEPYSSMSTSTKHVFTFLALRLFPGLPWRVDSFRPHLERDREWTWYLCPGPRPPCRERIARRELPSRPRGRPC